MSVAAKMTRKIKHQSHGLEWLSMLTKTPLFRKTEKGFLCLVTKLMANAIMFYSMLVLQSKEKSLIKATGGEKERGQL